MPGRIRSMWLSARRGAGRCRLGRFAVASPPSGSDGRPSWRASRHDGGCRGGRPGGGRPAVPGPGTSVHAHAARPPRSSHRAERAGAAPRSERRSRAAPRADARSAAGGGTADRRHRPAQRGRRAVGTRAIGVISLLAFILVASAALVPGRWPRTLDRLARRFTGGLRSLRAACRSAGEDNRDASPTTGFTPNLSSTRPNTKVQWIFGVERRILAATSERSGGERRDR
jgi:hypothetical protein